MIRTERTILRPWRDGDLDAFAAMLADPEVMADYGGPLARKTAARKLDRYRAAYERLGFSRLAVTGLDGEFLGYVGIMPMDEGHPRAPGVEIGWRLVRRAWGSGLATEAARACLDAGFADQGFDEVLSYTAASNLRSQSVMRKLNLERDPARDFEMVTDGQAWSGLVWVAHRPGRAWSGSTAG